MSDVPEKIYIDCDARWPTCNCCDGATGRQTLCYDHDYTDAVEYIRADLYKEKCVFSEQQRERSLRDHDTIGKLQAELRIYKMLAGDNQ